MLVQTFCTHPTNNFSFQRSVNSTLLPGHCCLNSVSESKSEHEYSRTISVPDIRKKPTLKSSRRTVIDGQKNVKTASTSARHQPSCDYVIQTSSKNKNDEFLRSHHDDTTCVFKELKNIKGDDVFTEFRLAFC